MTPPLARDTVKSAKAMAQQVAKQMAREPLEVLKTAGEQTLGERLPQPQAELPPQQVEPGSEASRQEAVTKDKESSDRRMEALTREIEDIRKHDLFNDLLRKVTQGEELALEEYPELTIEQKQVLKALAQAVKNGIESQNQGQVLQEPASRPGRRFGPTRKQEAEKQQTRVEKPVPPSG
ncbi:MAG TPA: hypothetical protein VJ227_00675 [Patescibacteria group bacterium]|nr:hypothetical protein [Patescibacteria group bacterium]